MVLVVEVEVVLSVLKSQKAVKGELSIALFSVSKTLLHLK